MKRFFIVFIIFLTGTQLSAQYPLTDCINNTFINMDSLSKIGKNAFEEWKNCVLDKPIPGFIASSISGDTIDINKLTGQVVVLNFWSINCLPCIAEMPGMNRLVKDYESKNVVFLAMTWESTQRVKNDFLTKYKFDFVILPDALQIIEKLAASGYPTTYVIDKKGIIKAAWNGGSTGSEAGDHYYQHTQSIIDKLVEAE